MYEAAAAAIAAAVVIAGGLGAWQRPWNDRAHAELDHAVDHVVGVHPRGGKHSAAPTEGEHSLRHALGAQSDKLLGIERREERTGTSEDVSVKPKVTRKFCSGTGVAQISDRRLHAVPKLEIEFNPFGCPAGSRVSRHGLAVGLENFAFPRPGAEGEHRRPVSHGSFQLPGQDRRESRRLVTFADDFAHGLLRSRKRGGSGGMFSYESGVVHHALVVLEHLLDKTLDAEIARAFGRVVRHDDRFSARCQHGRASRGCRRRP
mmetsp:Transcript_11454/g.30647  ORF Transcript_11454/g.30647 Transcript_11454/m.30647 type:complete len:261 (+) Transcript_11454:699-1481(+)